jgi:hypothetical protein
MKLVPACVAIRCIRILYSIALMKTRKRYRLRVSYTATWISTTRNLNDFRAELMRSVAIKRYRGSFFFVLGS